MENHVRQRIPYARLSRNLNDSNEYWSMDQGPIEAHRQVSYNSLGASGKELTQATTIDSMQETTSERAVRRSAVLTSDTWSATRPFPRCPSSEGQRRLTGKAVAAVKVIFTSSVHQVIPRASHGKYAAVLQP